MSACQFPFTTKTGHKVPCGRCPVCLEKKVAQWVFRLQQEAKMHDHVHFVTFTYSPEHVPANHLGELTLNKTHVQSFFKRIRKVLYKKIKYYAVGEYGSRFNRPHYHAIIFGCYAPELYQSCWPYGQVYVEPGHMTEAQMGYVGGYVQKGRIMKPHVQKEFSLMSKGLGENYINDQMINYHLDDP